MNKFWILQASFFLFSKILNSNIPKTIIDACYPHNHHLLLDFVRTGHSTRDEEYSNNLCRQAKFRDAHPHEVLYPIGQLLVRIFKNIDMLLPSILIILSSLRDAYIPSCFANNASRIE